MFLRKMPAAHPYLLFLHTVIVNHLTCSSQTPISLCSLLTSKLGVITERYRWTYQSWPFIKVSILAMCVRAHCLSTYILNLPSSSSLILSTLSDFLESSFGINYTCMTLRMIWMTPDAFPSTKPRDSSLWANPVSSLEYFYLYIIDL